MYLYLFIMCVCVCVCVVKVLKYSEHNLPEILEEARKQQRDIETTKV